MPRMKVLNNVARDAFETPPVFNSLERKRCFDFPVALQEIASGLRSASNQLGFWLTCGYFRATRRVYPSRGFHPRELGYLAERAGFTVATPSQEETDAGPLQQYFPDRDVVALPGNPGHRQSALRLDGRIPARWKLFNEKEGSGTLAACLTAGTGQL